MGKSPPAGRRCSSGGASRIDSTSSKSPWTTCAEQARAPEASLNDAFLAGLAGAMRLYHERLGSPVETMPFGVPISMRREGDPMASNRFTATVLAAPVGVVDPRARMERIHEQVLTARTERALTAVDSITPVFDLIPTSVLTAAFAGVSGDLNASNIAGPPMDLYLAGARILRLYGFGPLAGCAVMAGLISAFEICCIGINSDPAAVTEPEALPHVPARWLRGGAGRGRRPRRCLDARVAGAGRGKRPTSEGLPPVTPHGRSRAWPGRRPPPRHVELRRIGPDPLPTSDGRA